MHPRCYMLEADLQVESWEGLSLTNVFIAVLCISYEKARRAGSLFWMSSASKQATNGFTQTLANIVIDHHTRMAADSVAINTKFCHHTDNSVASLGHVLPCRASETVLVREAREQEHYKACVNPHDAYVFLRHRPSATSSSKVTAPMAQQAQPRPLADRAIADRKWTCRETWAQLGQLAPVKPHVFGRCTEASKSSTDSTCVPSSPKVLALMKG
eukprot:4716679-Amphidinium_carterae.1